jgi:GMP synthase-like glutamine amidotransferase
MGIAYRKSPRVAAFDDGAAGDFCDYRICHKLFTCCVHFLFTATIESLHCESECLCSVFKLFLWTPDMITRAVAFQHMDDEPPGLFGEFLNARGASIDVINLHRGEEIPSLAPYDFMLVMGGAMDVWDETQNPWLVHEKAAIREWAIHRNRPFFGVCLGMQLLAEALGGKVGLAREAEVGVGSVHLCGAHALAGGLPKNFKMMQWHHAEVTVLPEGAEVLASSGVTEVQIMAVGGNLLGTQFHGELTPDLVARWQHIPQYISWLEDSLGAGAYERVCAEALPLMPKMRAVSEAMFNNLVEGKALRAAA